LQRECDEHRNWETKGKAKKDTGKFPQRSTSDAWDDCQKRSKHQRERKARSSVAKRAQGSYEVGGVEIDKTMTGRGKLTERQWVTVLGQIYKIGSDSLP